LKIEFKCWNFKEIFVGKASKKFSLPKSFFINFHILLEEPKENDVFQISKKPIRNRRLALSDLKNEFC
jgi:hypothetical protein